MRKELQQQRSTIKISNKSLDCADTTVYSSSSNNSVAVPASSAMTSIEHPPPSTALQVDSNTTETTVDLPKAYRKRFSCQNKVRYFRSSKRRVQWIFGLTNLAALHNGKQGTDCCGQEHEVELSWSIRSGKTRVYWNKRNISNLFCDNLQDTSEFSWKLKDDLTVQVNIHADIDLGIHQFELIVDGVKFFDLPVIANLGVAAVTATDDNINNTASEDSVEQVYIPRDHALLNADKRQSRRSTHHHSNTKSQKPRLDSLDDSQIEDELPSDHYSSTLEELRDQVVECLPQLEEMISRTLISSFLFESSNNDSISSFSDESDQLHANALWNAYEWVNLNAAFYPRHEEVALEFMEKHVEEVFRAVCEEHLCASQAARIILGVAAILGLKFINSIPATSVIFCNLPRDYTTSELYHDLTRYGEIESIAVVHGRSFGLVCFVDAESAQRVQDDNSLLINNEDPKPLIISESLELVKNNNNSQAALLLAELPIEVPDKSLPHLMSNLSLDSKRPSIVLGNTKFGQSLPTLLYQQ